MKNNFVSLLSAAAAVVFATLGAAPVMAQAQGQTDKPAGTASTITTVNATVVHVDKTDRWVTLQLEDGTLADIQAGPAVKNFDQIRVGDHVTARQEETMAVAVVAGKGASPSASSGSSMVTAPPGSMPMAVVVDTATVTGKVTAVDYAKRTVTLMGPAGNSHTIEVGPEVKKFDAIKKGDDVVVTLKTATMIEVSPPAKGLKPGY